MSHEIWQRRLYAIGFTIGVFVLAFVILWLLSFVKIVVIILAVSILLAYVLVPAVRFFNSPIALTLPGEIPIFNNKINLFKRKEILLNKRGFSRVFSILIVYIILFILLWVTISYILPKVIFEFQKFYNNLPQLTSDVESSFQRSVDWLNSKLPPYFAKVLFPKAAETFLAEIKNISLSAFHKTIPFMFKFFSSLAIIFIVPLVTFYILMDVDKYKKAFMNFIPSSRKEDISDLLKKIDRVLGRFIRGQLIVCFCIGISVTIALTLWGIEYPFLIGAFSGIIDIIPYLGVIVGMVPAVILALLKSPWIAVGVFITLVILHWSEGHIIIPLVVGQVVGLPPLIIIVALLVGAELMGIPGMFLAVPFAAMIRVIVSHYLEKLEP